MLRELVHLDPALEAHPKIDSQLLRDTPMRYHERPQQQLGSARRRAYFEWTEGHIAKVADEDDPKRSLSLAQGRNLPRFRDIPLMDAEVSSGALCRSL